MPDSLGIWGSGDTIRNSMPTWDLGRSYVWCPLRVGVISPVSRSGQVQAQRECLAEDALFVLLAQLADLAYAARPLGWRARRLERRHGARSEILVEIAGAVSGEAGQLGEGERGLGVGPQVE